MQHVRELREGYKEEFNEQLTQGEARVILGQLVQIYLLLMRPLDVGLRTDASPALSW
jgi:hypothetical protein